MTLSPLLSASPLIQIHALLGAAVLLLGLGHLILPKGTPRHRMMGWLWVGLLVGAAGTSLAIFEINDGRPSLVHLLSLAGLLYLPFLVLAARGGRVGNHLRIAYGLVFGVVVVASLSTLMPGRLVHEALFGAVTAAGTGGVGG